MKRLLDGYHRLLQATVTLLLAVMVIPVLLQILSGFASLIPRYIWTEEIARFCFVWIVMLGSIIAVRDGSHFNVDLLPHPKTKRQRGVAGLIVHGSMALFAVMFAWFGIDFAKLGWQQTSELSGINLLSLHLSFPLAGVSWLLFLGERIVRDLELLDADHDDA